MMNKSKYSFIEDHRESVIHDYKVKEMSIDSLCDKYNIKRKSLIDRLKKWGIYELHKSQIGKTIKSKYSFLEKHREEITRRHCINHESALKLSKSFGVGFGPMIYRLRKWGIFESRGYGNPAIDKLGDSTELLLEDRKSGMSLRYLEKKYDVSHATLMEFFKKKGIKGKVKQRKPKGEELEKLLEDLKSELFFLDELTHFYILPEKSILEIAYKNKCIVNFDYDKTVDFMMFDESRTLNSILREEKLKSVRDSKVE